MSLASVLYPSPTSGGHEEWTFANYQLHLQLLTGLQNRFGQPFTLYRIWPAPETSLQGFLEQHQQQHNDVNGALGIPGNDLSSVDFKNQKQRDAWFWLHFLEHQQAAHALGLSL